jgi:hypothetical protein
MKNEKQTAVEWLFNRLQSEPFLTHEDFNKAKEMEKEQIEDAVSHGWDNNENGKVRWLGEQYYNETYGGAK